MPRLYLLGSNNPESSDPRHALFPHNEASTGYRMWKMVEEASGLPMDDWLAGTQRVNLLTDMILPRGYQGAMRRRGDFLRTMIHDRIVVVLGKDVAEAMRLDTELFVWGGPSGRWVTIPHPSGRNHWYNNPVHRFAAGALLYDLWMMCNAETAIANRARTVA